MSHLNSGNSKILSRIRRIKGQLEGVERMILNEDDCYAVLQSATACRGALNSLTRELILEHINHHLIEDPKASDSMREAAGEIQNIIKSFLK